MENKTINISTLTLIKIAAFILGLWLLWVVRDVVVLFIFVLIIVAALDPLIDWFQVRKIPRPVSIIFIYLLIFAIFGLLVYFIIPPLVTQIFQLAQTYPEYIYRIQNLGIESTDWQKALVSLANQLSQLSGSVWQAALNIFGGIVSFITVLFLSFYMLLEEKPIKETIAKILPADRREQILRISHGLTLKLGGWLRGQLLLSLVVGVVDYIGLLIIGVPYALVLAMLAGVLEIVPYLGPIISGVAAIAVAFSYGGIWSAVAVLILYVIVQQVESQILVPKIMQKSVGLSPVIIILALLIGAKILGLVGMILAIPVAAGLSVLISEWPNLRRTG
jgi:predicted PurR-regulated permease PerM